MSDDIVMQLGTSDFTGWKSISVQRTMESFCGSFTVELVDKQGSATNQITEGIATKLFVKEDLFGANYPLINGYIDGVKLKLSGQSTQMSIQGRDITCDMIDSAAIAPSNTWTKAKFSKIIRAIVLPFGITVDTSQLIIDEEIDKFTLQNGETAYEAIERLCRSQAVLPLTDFEGNLLLTYSADTTVKADEDLVVGDNVLEVEREASWADRYSEYFCRGQRSGKGKAWDGRITQMVAVATDLAIDRYRPMVFMSENKATDRNLQSRVNWEAQVRAGRGTFYNVVVQGWFQHNAITRAKTRLWTVNERVNIKVPRWGVDEQQLITAVDYHIDESGGRKTRLVLKNVDVYKSNPTEEVALT